MSVVRPRLVVFSALLAVSLAVPAEAWIAQKGGAAASTSQIFLSNSTGNASASVDRYFPFGYTGPILTSSFRAFVFPTAGALKEFKATSLTQPSGSAKYTITIVVNGSSTSAACDITSSVAICDWTGSVSVNAGDTAYILTHPTSAPTASIISTSAVFQPTTANETIIPSAATNAAFNTSATYATVPFSGHSPSTVSTRRHAILPDGGTIDKLYADTNAPGTPGSGKSYAFTMVKNNSTTSVTTTISDDATTGNDTANSFTVSAGDDISFQGAPTGTPTASNAAFGSRYVPSTAGRFPLIMASGATGDSATATTYFQLSGGNSVGNATEANAQHTAHSMTIEKMRVKVLAAPGSGKSRTLTLRQNGADTALTCTIADTATTCTATANVTVSTNDKLDTSDVPTSSPAAATIGIAYLATR